MSSIPIEYAERARRKQGRSRQKHPTGWTGGVFLSEVKNAGWEMEQPYPGPLGLFHREKVYGIDGGQGSPAADGENQLSE